MPGAKLCGHQESGNAGHQGRREAAAGEGTASAAGYGALDVPAGGEHAVGRVGGTPVADRQGSPSGPAAPTASTEGTAAGTCRQSHPSLPTAATTRTPLSSHSRRARSSMASTWTFWLGSPPLMLMMWAPSWTARSTARARSSCGTRPCAPSRNTGSSSPRQRGTSPATGLSGWPKSRLATWVPCCDIGPGPAGCPTSVSSRVRSAPAKQGWVRSTGPSRTATHTESSPRSESCGGCKACRTDRASMLNHRSPCSRPVRGRRTEWHQPPVRLSGRCAAMCRRRRRRGVAASSLRRGPTGAGRLSGPLRPPWPARRGRAREQLPRRAADGDATPARHIAAVAPTGVRRSHPRDEHAPRAPRCARQWN